MQYDMVLGLPENCRRGMECLSTLLRILCTPQRFTGDVLMKTFLNALETTSFFISLFLSVRFYSSLGPYWSFIKWRFWCFNSNGIEVWVRSTSLLRKRLVIRQTRLSRTGGNGFKLTSGEHFYILKSILKSFLATICSQFNH